MEIRNFSRLSSRLTLREGIRTSTVVKEPFRVIFKAPGGKLKKW
jgi:hypothetical protein